MLIADTASTLPLVWSLVPANADERKETLALLKVLFRLWPECPMEVLVGDGLYDKSKDFAHELVFGYGIQPIFPKTGGYSRHLPHVATDGIPVCACKEPMVFKDTDGNLFTAAQRAKLGIPRGQEAPRLDGRLRWKCAAGVCKTKSARPVDDPRLYTYHHRGGDHKLAYLRKALMLRRNAVESIFASVKHLGLGGRAVDRPSWADDDEMDWLVSTALVFQTGRRLIHEGGLYERAHDELERLELLEQPTLQRPAPGPSARALAAELTLRWGAIEGEAAPRSWAAGGLAGEWSVPLGGGGGDLQAAGAA